MSAGWYVFTAFAFGVPLMALWPLLTRPYESRSSRLQTFIEWMTILGVALVATLFYIGIIYDLP